MLLGASCSNPDRCFDASCLGGGGAGATGGSTTTTSPATGGTGGTGGAGGVPPLEGVCGNGIVEEGEGVILCDGENFNGNSCESLVARPGRLICYGDCTIGAGFCGGTCTGNGAVDMPQEVCDGLPLACDMLIPGATGEAACGKFCIDRDTSACSIGAATCGNLTVEAPEQCDGPTSTTCVNLGFVGGTLGCHPNCTFDTQACHQCGDGVVHPGEQCDLANLGPTTCENLRYAGGTLSCNPDCTFDTSGCITCGNDRLNDGEACDGTDFGGLTCVSLGFSGGELACDVNCMRDTTGCL